MLGGIVTAALIAVFAAITVWAYAERRRATFDALARLPLEDDSTAGRAP